MPAFDGQLFWRGDDGYEPARDETVFHGRTPARFPSAIVKAASEADVARAIALAAKHDLQVSVRSGGHSWAGNHVRDGVLLLDVSGLDSAEVDVDARTAVVGPGARGNELMLDLREDGLYFPSGHCVGVGLGGFLLQGGFGWDSRNIGPACMSVEAVDVVTAAGETLHANAEQNSDLFWAARGSGPGFFAVVTKFHLRLHEWPGVARNRVIVYPLDCLEEVYRWANEIGPSVPASMELLVIMKRDPEGVVQIAVTGPVLAATVEEAEAVHALLDTCPVIDRAIVNEPSADVTIAELYDVLSENHPDECRCAADGMWTHAPIDDLLPGIRKIAETIGPAPSYMLWMNWGPFKPERPDMAFSLEDQIYIAVYSTWLDAGLDDELADWPAERMRDMAEFSTGIQLADENLDARPAPFMAPDNARRLAELRSKHDPGGRFHPGPYG